MQDSTKVMAVIIRYTEYESRDPRQCVAVKGIYDSFEMADAEESRLNSIRHGDRRVEYFVVPGRFASGDQAVAAEPPGA